MVAVFVIKQGFFGGFSILKIMIKAFSGATVRYNTANGGFVVYKSISVLKYIEG